MWLGQTLQYARTRADSLGLVYKIIFALFSVLACPTDLHICQRAALRCLDEIK